MGELKKGAPVPRLLSTHYTYITLPPTELSLIWLVGCGSMRSIWCPARDANLLQQCFKHPPWNSHLDSRDLDVYPTPQLLHIMHPSKHRLELDNPGQRTSEKHETHASTKSCKTTTVRHRLPKRKVNNVWKPLSSKSCDIVQEALVMAMRKTHPDSDYPSLRRIETLMRKLTGNMRVPVGVYTGLKLNDDGQLDLITLDRLKKNNEELELLIKQREQTMNLLQERADPSILKSSNQVSRKSKNKQEYPARR